ncbi:hypothetical protein I316_06181 [Kwoniella heveanensis BCC8398]|uniref:Aldose 1-epimerase n=1 Tax=Kwoniella heveanensis BCC8398 TaxID=1296120 RepID=A0A1B9GMM1_9TREE|nr:hypothetical protein I316_06181 [Kwoniella heveanensis BCC8398]
MAPTVFGQHNGEDVLAIEIRSADQSTSATIITLGAAIQDLRVSASEGQRSVILGFDNLEGYVANQKWHHGAIAGRFANRIANGRFTLDGEDYQVEINEPSGHSCHSGKKGFGHKNWKLEKHDGQSVTLRHTSSDGDQGFPGTLEAFVTYSLPSAGVIRIEYRATTDKTTPVNLTNHSYFNVDGTRGSSINDTLQQKLTIDADKYTPVDDGLIPTGELVDVAGTPFDFRSSRPIQLLDESANKPFHYDHNFVLRSPSSPGQLHRAAELVSSKGDLTLECWTDQPGIQIFDGAPLDIKEPGLGGARNGYRTGVCLETQIWPGSLGHEHFPQSVIKPGEEYRHLTEYRFHSA